MRKIRLWVFMAAIWVAKKACYNGLCYDELNEAKKTEWQHYNWIREDDDYYDPTI